MERLWADLQRELAARSSRAKHIVASANSHHIPLSEPELVVAAIRQILERPPPR